VEHIGSTAVPGMPAKPILDLMPGVATPEDAQRCVEPIRSLGYEYKGEMEIPGRFYFVLRHNGLSMTHLHLFPTSHPEWQKHLRFRDYLRAHSEAAAEYARLKRELAGKFATQRQAYTNAKDAFIQSILLTAEFEK
jgi:GrpB-like predicted nucleotidyltransferase (UPF0157 family)